MDRTPPPPLPPELAARFEPVRVLGQGGYGTVILARDRRADRQVAIKLLHGDCPDPAARERFSQEARLAAELRHPHLVEVVESGILADGAPFLVTGFVPGGTLRERLSRAPRPTSGEILAWGMDLASALEALHAEGVVHRDVKPENVLLSPERGAVLADLGIARELAARGLTGTGTLLGTPAAMAPELWRMEPASPASDQFALAALLHECATGSPVYPGDTPGEVASHVLRGGGAVVRNDLMPDRPGAADALRRALSNHPGDRFPSLADFRAGLAATASASATTRTGSPESTDSPAAGMPRIRAQVPLTRSLRGAVPGGRSAAAGNTVLLGREPSRDPSPRRPAIPGRLVALATLALLAAFLPWTAPTRDPGTGTGTGPDALPGPADSEVAPAAPPLPSSALARKRVDESAERMLEGHFGADHALLEGSSHPEAILELTRELEVGGIRRRLLETHLERVTEAWQAELRERGEAAFSDLESWHWFLTQASFLTGHLLDDLSGLRRGRLSAWFLARGEVELVETALTVARQLEAEVTDLLVASARRFEEATRQAPTVLRVMAARWLLDLRDPQAIELMRQAEDRFRARREESMRYPLADLQLSTANYFGGGPMPCPEVGRLLAESERILGVDPTGSIEAGTGIRLRLLEVLVSSAGSCPDHPPPLERTQALVRGATWLATRLQHPESLTRASIHRARALTRNMREAPFVFHESVIGTPLETELDRLVPQLEAALAP